MEHKISYHDPVSICNNDRWGERDCPDMDTNDLSMTYEELEIPVYSEDRSALYDDVLSGRTSVGEEERVANKMVTRLVDREVGPPVLPWSRGNGERRTERTRSRGWSGPSRRRVDKCCMGYGFPEGLGDEAPSE